MCIVCRVCIAFVCGVTAKAIVWIAVAFGKACLNYKKKKKRVCLRRLLLSRSLLLDARLPVGFISIASSLSYNSAKHAACSLFGPHGSCLSEE